MRLRQKPRKIRPLILVVRPTPVLLQRSTRKNQQAIPVRLAILARLKNQLSQLNRTTLAPPPTRVRRTSNGATMDVSRATGG